MGTPETGRRSAGGGTHLGGSGAGREREGVERAEKSPLCKPSSLADAFQASVTGEDNEAGAEGMSGSGCFGKYLGS
jgi:hypothetical protein